ncbi:MAG: entericidin A/B family lipoprotein [Rhodospirillales bacterium]|nr:entericidin A/B family lipoprotein [Alphaproteobacteria bacterium]MCB9976801.1 entericidin A/B family lipoprotein [Rhodospirillales bacterium]
MKKVLMMVCLFAVTGFVAGCSNTMEGAGRDIEKAGQKVQDTF